MKIGLASTLGADGVPLGPWLMRAARTAEALGFESLWTGEHSFLPANIANQSRHGYRIPAFYRNMADMFIMLTAVAAVTTRLKVGTGVCILPQRNPLILAKEVATLDLVSSGRLVFGIGSGWIEEEFQILGVPFKDRVKVTYETVRALKKLWTEDPVEFCGEHVNFAPLHCNPKPFQKPHPPILIGAGNAGTDNSAVLKRVAQCADGWLPLGLTAKQMCNHVKQLKEYCAVGGRDSNELDVSVLVTPAYIGLGSEGGPSFGPPPESEDARPKNTAELLAEYEAAGVTRLILSASDLATDEGLRELEHLSKRIGLM